MEQLEHNGLTMVDLYCGAGIGAVGFKLAGYDIIDAIDNVPYAVDTYNANIGNHARVADMRDVESGDIPYADVYVGGFPCKSWSVAGKELGKADERYGDLGWHFWRVVKDNQPKAFLLENVKGIVSKKHIKEFNQLIQDFSDAGYNIEWKVMNAYDYGVPQLRERVFAVGLRKDLGISFLFPDVLSFKDRKVLKDAIGDLPDPNNVNNHYGIGIRNDEAKFIDKVPIGGNWKDLPIEDQKAFMGGAFEAEGGKTGFLRKVDVNKPAYTITSQMNGKSNSQILDDGVKPRRFTVRECLRIQSVPDWFSFSDDISIVNQYSRCSGIPSLVAYKLGIEIAKHLNKGVGQMTFF